MGCDARLPIRTGYTVSFQKSKDVKKLEKYFKDISQNQWKTLGEDMFWMREEIFWSFTDYVHQHLEVEPDVVKLAFEFTNGVSKNEKQKKVAQEMLAITHKMGAKALAEGVETEEDLKCLIEMGYDLFQGYYFANPHPTPVKEIHSIYV
ncbi:EAL domain-containing protein [Priestia megaterium]|uniref:EAL domain-containing protein n=1 Tax=Priestia megaterium TaxID=1404 RepID=UPI003D00B638